MYQKCDFYFMGFLSWLTTKNLCIVVAIKAKRFSASSEDLNSYLVQLAARLWPSMLAPVGAKTWHTRDFEEFKFIRL